MAKPTLYMMMGLPASGKSTWIKNNLVEGRAAVVSPDLVMTNPETGAYVWSPEACSQAWALSYRMAGALLSAGKDVVFDATFCSVISRSALLNLALGMGATVHGVYIKTSAKECKARNALRSVDRRVPEEVLTEMADTFEAPTAMEGFDILYSTT